MKNKDITLEEITAILEELWTTPTININEGWSDDGENRYWMFMAELPMRGRGYLGTGIRGFLRTWTIEDINYNGTLISSAEEKQKFKEYCLNKLK